MSRVNEIIDRYGGLAAIQSLPPETQLQIRNELLEARRQDQISTEKQAQGSVTDDLMGLGGSLGGMYLGSKIAGNLWGGGSAATAAGATGATAAGTEAATQAPGFLGSFGEGLSSAGSYVNAATGGSFGPVASGAEYGSSLAGAQSGVSGSLGSVAGVPVLPVLGGALGAYGLYKGLGDGKKNPLGGAASGAALGASLGSVVPGIGTVIGGLGGAAIGGLAEMFGTHKSTKQYQQERSNKLANKFPTYSAFYQQLKAGEGNAQRAAQMAAPDFVGKDDSGTWINNRFKNSGDVKDLKAEDIWGSQAMFEKYGDDWLGKKSEQERRQIAQQALDSGAVSTRKGMIEVDWNKVGSSPSMPSRDPSKFKQGTNSAQNAIKALQAISQKKK